MRKKILTIAMFICYTAIFASNWLNQVTDTVNTVNSIVNPEQAVKITIQDLSNSGNRYVNKTVQVSGKVMGMAVDNNNQFVIFIQDPTGKIQVKVKNNPNCKLLDQIKVTGLYNGTEITNAVINS